MPKSEKIISVEVTQVLQIRPDQERKRLALHFTGKSLKRLHSMIANVEAGRFYEGAKTFYKECTPEEREAVGISMQTIFEGIGTREVNKLAWAEHDPERKVIETRDGHVLTGYGLDYPKYSLAGAGAGPAQEQTTEVKEVENLLGEDSPGM